jgi:hypothetical protein
MLVKKRFVPFCRYLLDTLLVDKECLSLLLGKDATYLNSFLQVAGEFTTTDLIQIAKCLDLEFATVLGILLRWHDEHVLERKK